MNTILCKTSHPWEKIYIFLCVELEFRSHNSFLSPVTAYSQVSSKHPPPIFTSAFDMALFMTSHFGEQPMSLLRRSRNPAGNSVWLRDKTSKTLEGRQRKLGGTSQCFSTLRMSARTIHSCFIQTFHTPSL